MISGKNIDQIVKFIIMLISDDNFEHMIYIHEKVAGWNQLR